MTNDPIKICNVQPYKEWDGICVGNSNYSNISHIGDSYLDTKHSNLKLKDVLVVSNLKRNLFPIG